jgi:hypothetical protein
MLSDEDRSKLPDPVGTSIGDQRGRRHNYRSGTYYEATAWTQPTLDTETWNVFRR